MILWILWFIPKKEKINSKSGDFWEILDFGKCGFHNIKIRTNMFLHTEHWAAKMEVNKVVSEHLWSIQGWRVTQIYRGFNIFWASLSNIDQICIVVICLFLRKKSVFDTCVRVNRWSFTAEHSVNSQFGVILTFCMFFCFVFHKSKIWGSDAGYCFVLFCFVLNPFGGAHSPVSERETRQCETSAAKWKQSDGTVSFTLVCVTTPEL